MREMGIRAQWTKPWTTTTKDSNFSKELHNILNEQFNPERPNAVWCTDITYIWTQGSKAILIVVILTIMPASNLSIPESKENGLTDFISLTTNMPIGLYLSILKPFIIPLGFHSHCDYMSPNDFEKLFERVSSLPAA